MQPNQIEQNDEHRYDIDALRVIAVILLVFFHTAMIFNLWVVFHIQNNELSLEFALFVRFFNIWHMSLFFFLAGMSTFYALNFRSGKHYLKERFKRLLIPLIFGILIVVPPQVYYERLAWWCETRHSPINFKGSYLEFYPQFFIPLYPNGNFSWHHLWFLWYLFFISIVALPLFLYLKKDRGKQEISKMANFIAKGQAIFLLSIPIILVNISLRWLFPMTHDFVSDWAIITNYLLIFLLGFLIVSNKLFEDSIDRNKILALIFGIITSIIILTVTAIFYINSIEFDSFLIYAIGMALWSFSEWCWLVAILGYGRKFLSKKNSFINYASKIALPFYILHQTVIIVLAFYVIQLETSIIVKYLIISTLALFITVILCELVKTNNITRYIFGMKLRKKEDLKKF